MAQHNFNIRQKQQHSLILSTEMKQSLHLLQSNIWDVHAYLKEQSMANPLFEVNPHVNQPEAEIASYWRRSDVAPNLVDYLIAQIKFLPNNQAKKILVGCLVPNLDEYGYLEIDEQQILQDYSLNEAEFAAAKSLLKQLEPLGLGSRSLQEYLLLQLKTFNQPLALNIVRDCFDLLQQQNFQQIAHQLQVPVSQVHEAITVIRQLRPRPYEPAGEKNINFKMPELSLKNVDGQLSLQIISQSQPQLIFAQETYATLKQNTDLEVQGYIKEKYNSYISLKQHLQQRLVTLTSIGQVIINAQRSFFLHQTDTLEPLLLKDVAAKLQLHESTVSRAVRDKYLQTDSGIYELRELFSPATLSQKEISTDKVRKCLQNLIAREDKNNPLSDQQLAQALQRENINIARRTIAKYRQQLSIPSAYKRKKD